jgi:RNA polymerase sigma-70 factor (ECF subfamily)
MDPDALSGLLEQNCAAGVAPDEPAIARAEAAEVRQALTTLPDDQRRALLLAAVGGRSALEVAETEGIPLGTAKTRIRTGLRRLRNALEETAARGV